MQACFKFTDLLWTRDSMNSLLILVSSPSDGFYSAPCLQVNYLEPFCALPMVLMFLVREDSYYCHWIGFIEICLPIFAQIHVEYVSPRVKKPATRGTGIPYDVYPSQSLANTTLPNFKTFPYQNHETMNT